MEHKLCKKNEESALSFNDDFHQALDHHDPYLDAHVTTIHSPTASKPPPPMWNNTPPPPQVDTGSNSSGPPKPLWNNRPPSSTPTSACSSACGPSPVTTSTASTMPKPMWSNRPPPNPTSITSPGGSGVPKPMWSNRKPTNASNQTWPGEGPSLNGASQDAPLDWGQAKLGGVEMKKIESMRDDGKRYIKQYELGETLGKGSYAKVKLCFDTEADRQKYAIKIFNKSLLKRRRTWDSTSGYRSAFDDVLREIAIMRKLDHPNVMSMRDVIDDVYINKLYMVMLFCPRGALMDSQKLPCAALELESCRKWFVDTLTGLDYLHFHDIVHFDLKPDNILIADNDQAMIADFGVSRNILGEGDLTSGSPGTPSYTAPEVWGQSKYEAKGADVWSLGVTLHAIVFGTLPFFFTDQQELIENVTSAEEWVCKIDHPDSALLDLLHGIIKKNPEERLSLEQIKKQEWVAVELAGRDTTAFTRIEVDEEEIRKAVITGHVESFRRTDRGTLLKTTWREEADMYQRLGKSDMCTYLPKLHGVQDSLGGRAIIEMEDLTLGVDGTCLMDVKMGVRTFTEHDVSDDALRDDLLQKMLKVDPDAATAEELAQGGITKLRYLQFREASTTSSKLGYRIDAVRLCDAVAETAPFRGPDELRLVEEEAGAHEVISEFLQGRNELRTSFREQLLSIRTCMENSPIFMRQSFIRTSLLFVYSHVTSKASLHVIDLSRAYEANRNLTHRSEWVSGNHEDGYLTGLDNLIRAFN